uniref:Uncharacterized protein n=1 Tax=viral metagenome TaxID=1070528 RepID=A0A6M3J944_9ZZZZ
MADWQRILGGLGAGLQDAGAHLQGQPGQANKVSQFNKYVEELKNDKEYTEAAKALQTVQGWLAVNKFTSQGEMIERMKAEPAMSSELKFLTEYMTKPGKHNEAMFNTFNQMVTIEAQNQKKELEQIDKNVQTGYKARLGTGEATMPLGSPETLQSYKKQYGGEVLPNYLGAPYADTPEYPKQGQVFQKTTQGKLGSNIWVTDTKSGQARRVPDNPKTADLIANGTYTKYEKVSEAKTGKTYVASNFRLPSGDIVLSQDGGKTYLSSNGKKYPMPADSIKITQSTSLSEMNLEKAKSKAGKDLSETNISGEPLNMKKAALGGTGPYRKLFSAIDNVAGGLGVDMAFGADGLFPETQENKQRLQELRQLIKPAFMNSSRGAVWEQEQINKLVPDPEKIWRNPRNEAKKIGNLRNVLGILKSEHNQTISQALTLEEAQEARAAIRNIDRVLTLLGTPQTGNTITSEDEALINKYLR